MQLLWKMNINQGTSVTEHTLLTQANFFLHQFDAVNDRVTFINSTQEKLNHISFLDGRDNFSVDNTHYVHQASQLLANESLTVKTPVTRYIYHVGFCGSTLLAKTLGHILSKVQCLKEPQVLIDLANLKAQNHLHYRDRSKWQQGLNVVINQLGKTFTKDQHAMIKPSNWVNSLLPDLVTQVPEQKAVFLTIDLAQYLLAIFRGGKARINFIYHLREHLLAVMPEYKTLINQIDNSGEDIYIKVAKSAAVVYMMQHSQFSRAQASLPSCQWTEIYYQQLIEQPFDTLKQAGDTLSLPLTDKELLSAISELFGQHAKQDKQRYTYESQQEVDKQVLQAYSPAINSALDWYALHVDEQGRQIA
ncbi:hypothetical protein HII17_09640 [Thalassotalea sp. M1531]|uniref:Uncharacterized protein n=1 Tax=Thalassotalea algicola TaxID=2716224 RepID=A0A7Y0LCB6_9GAMM|nr:sulfotransferase [Thalassotalea algicola]NMP31826.1 hypothetical protein [Thalassotalea algicola]